MTTPAVLAVLSPMILIVFVAVACVLAVWFALFIVRIVFWLTVGGLIGLALWAGEARANTAAPDRWGIVFVACGNGAATRCNVRPAPLPVFATSGLCMKGLSAYKEGVAKVFELSIRPDLANGSPELQCRKAHWCTTVGGYRYEGEE